MKSVSLEKVQKVINYVENDEKFNDKVKLQICTYKSGYGIGIVFLSDSDIFDKYLKKDDDNYTFFGVPVVYISHTN